MKMRILVGSSLLALLGFLVVFLRGDTHADTIWPETIIFQDDISTDTAGRNATSGQVRWALQFSPDPDYVVVPPSESINFGQDMTIDFAPLKDAAALCGEVQDAKGKPMDGCLVYIDNVGYNTKAGVQVVNDSTTTDSSNQLLAIGHPPMDAGAQTGIAGPQAKVNGPVLVL